MCSAALAETMTQLSLLNVESLAGIALGAAVLSHNSAGQPLRSPVTLLQDRDGPTHASGLKSLPRQGI